MTDYNIILPSKPRAIKEEDFKGSYEIDGLYPGYGHTLGNSLRRIILSSLPGAAITKVIIEGVDHEFSTVSGIKEDVVMLILNLKKTRFKMSTDEPQKVTLSVSGAKEVTAGQIEVPSTVEVLNPEQYIATITDKGVKLNIEMTVEKGLGYVSKELLHKDRVEIGTIALDASFTPIRRVNYEVENMRVGDRTDYNRLKMFVETDGTLTPREALERSIETMIAQLKAIVGFATEEPETTEVASSDEKVEAGEGESTKGAGLAEEDILKMRVEDINFSSRTQRALAEASIRTIGGLARKSEDDLLEISGLGEKGVAEIKRALADFGINLKS
ncbi:MAG: DNA-directed RNA polymerase subunit alpha [Candidatus Paceibacterota bacterium]|jgi:DNA-directed RNA polymerase subunit alpha